MFKLDFIFNTASHFVSHCTVELVFCIAFASLIAQGRRAGLSTDKTWQKTFWIKCSLFTHSKYSLSLFHICFLSLSLSLSLSHSLSLSLSLSLSRFFKGNNSWLYGSASWPRELLCLNYLRTSEWPLKQSSLFVKTAVICFGKGHK